MRGRYPGSQAAGSEVLIELLGLPLVSQAFFSVERWLTRVAGTGETVHIPFPNTDLVADLKRGLSEARKSHRKNSRS